MSSLRDLIGVELGPTGWVEVSQVRIDEFARATGDAQWIHTDSTRAAGGPFGTTIGHGFLTLSLCSPLLSEALADLTGYRLTVNYGVNRVRFPAPVPAGSRVRARIAVVSVGEVPGGDQAVVRATVEREGGEKPVCVAELILRMMR